MTNTNMVPVLDDAGLGTFNDGCWTTIVGVSHRSEFIIVLPKYI